MDARSPIDVNLALHPQLGAGLLPRVGCNYAAPPPSEGERALQLANESLNITAFCQFRRRLSNGMTVDRNRVLLYVLTAVLVAGYIETTLALLAWASPRVVHLLAPPWSPTVSDNRLGHRPSSTIQDHDSRGWRNPTAYTKADIVAIGDSQTYGEGVSAMEAWPRQLEEMTSRPVYSMAYGGYGPVHSLLLWDEAAQLDPGIVIAAFYAGNDLFDSFNIVYKRGQLPELKSATAETQRAIKDAERAEPLSRYGERMFYMGRPGAIGEKHPVASSWWSWPAGLLSTYSKTYGLLRRARYELQRDRVEPVRVDMTWDGAKALAQDNSAYTEIMASGEFKTIITPEYRLAAVNLKDVRIAEGLQLSLNAIDRMHQLASTRGIRLIVVLIPTKEYVFSELWKDRSKSKSYLSLTENEEQLWHVTKAYLDRHGIAYLDELPALRAELADGVQPYPVTRDGHPNRYGHRAIAQAMVPLIRQLRGAR